MPEYTLRNINPEIWSLFTARARREGWPTKALFVALMEAYARGQVNVGTPPPKQLPAWAWLRTHYRAVAQAAPDFKTQDVDHQWQAIIERVLRSPASMSWRELQEVPTVQRAEILTWLAATSNLPPGKGLTLRASGHVGDGPDLRSNRRVYQYDVLGLPPGESALITDYKGGWRVMYITPGVDRDWSGPFETPEEALETLARTVAADADSADPAAR